MKTTHGLPYLTKKKSRGRTYWYFRRAEGYIRLPDPDAPDFLAKYDAAKRGVSLVPTGARTWQTLIASYRQSPAWKDLAPRTKRDYEKVLEWAIATMPALDPSRMMQPHIVRARDANQHRRRFANYIVQVLGILFAHAIEKGWMTHNPAKGVKLLRKPRGEAEVHGPWAADVIAAYRAAAPIGSSERTAFELSLGLSQRIGDTIKLRWDQWGPDGFEIQQSKTGTALTIPPTDTLAAYLNQIERGTTTIVTGARVGAMTYSGVYSRFVIARAAAVQAALDAGDERLAARIKASTQHGLRYTVAHQMAEAGIPDNEISAVTGHKTLAMLRKYAGAARQKGHAKAGQSKRNESEKGTDE